MVAWYVYGNQRIPKRTFEDKYFRNIMKSCYQCGHVCANASQARDRTVYAGTKAPTLKEKVLKSWVRAELEVLVLLLKFIMLQKHHHDMREPLAQVLHNRDTLNNGKKYQ